MFQVTAKPATETPKTRRQIELVMSHVTVVLRLHGMSSHFRYTLTMSCHMRLRRYPFDKQDCFIRIESCKYPQGNPLMRRICIKSPVQRFQRRMLQSCYICTSFFKQIPKNIKPFWSSSIISVHKTSLFTAEADTKTFSSAKFFQTEQNRN